MSQNQTSIIRQGSTFRRLIKVESLSGSAVLDGAAAFCQLRYKSGKEVIANMDVDLSQASEGKVSISISASVTEGLREGAAKSDILFVWADGSKTHTPIFDVRVEETITRAT